MTLVSDIIHSAHRESNLIAIEGALTPAQVTEGLKRLNVIVAAAYGYEVGDPFQDVDFEQELHCPLDVNVRLIPRHTGALSVKLFSSPRDGARMAVVDANGTLAAAPLTIMGNGRAIEGQQAVICNEAGMARTWLYRADLGEWVRLTTLEAADELPFPLEFDDYFITQLAMRLNPRYGRSMTEESVAAMGRSLSKLRARYRQNSEAQYDPALTHLTGRRNIIGGLGLIG